MAFTRNVENFICEHCGASVEGDGYTNHCTQCLWSKHVDIDPGDRGAACGGLMEPLRIEGTTPHYIIVHRCTKCGFERRNKVQDRDNPEAIVEIVRTNAARTT